MTYVKEVWETFIDAIFNKEGKCSKDRNEIDKIN
jgi:hypothetical protein